MLSTCGAGLEAIAGPACAISRQLVDGDMAGMFWTDTQGAPAGFYHETDRVDLKDLFVSRFEELFTGPGQENMLTLTAPIGPSIGRALATEYLERFWQGNVYRHLCVPLDHHYMLDVRIEADDGARAVLIVWHRGQRRFTARDAERLRPVQASLKVALETAQADAHWVRRSSGRAHMITDTDGGRLLAIDAEAEKLLMRSHLFAQNVTMAQRPRVAPAFAQVLAGLLATEASARYVAQVPNGRIVAEARHTSLLDEAGGERAAMYIALSEETSLAARCIDHLMGQPLTPLQRDLALFGMKGGERSDCCAAFGISAEALKKHTAAILAALCVGRWTELTALAGAVTMG
ncbi:MAG: hypothetical protein KKE02_20550 [Alphaproteobacteria bacterium]|nr:hypothetical protein [Alphaproteobacteria bacterium]MBU1515783.1 hypothetical protein [Alphaproteobacteria bacterium]MBU2094005.1 hypothetical protein [Alphaproteobacteria bacterium]MBU2153421.1 hypothetical protein [Alphaproteobacteria bacterium]MBU2308849.1 hypothetical protein [Alphaproteobacteria bacterium]